MSRPVPWPRALAALVAMELRLAVRRGENVLVTLVVPSAVLVFFATIDIAPEAERPLVVFLLPGTVALAIIATSLVNLGIATGYERAYGVLKRFGGAPVHRTTVIAAKLSAVAIVVVAQLGLLVAIAALALGWVPDEPVVPGLVALGLVLGTAAFAGLGLALAGALRAEATLAVANGLFIAFLFLGGIVLPVDHLPGVLAELARLLPAGALSETMRVGFGAGGEALPALAILAAWAAAGSVAALRLFRWE